MRRLFTLKAVAGAGALAIGLSALAAPANAAPDDPTVFCADPVGWSGKIAPIDTLTDGQDVTWKSTVKGTEPQEFTGEYIGKLDNALGKDANGNPRDLLLVKLSGSVTDGTDGRLPAGVWAGASGSPVYDENGALLGAVSYGFSNEADNVAGVTPAALMKSIGNLPGKVAYGSLNAAGKELVQENTGVSAAKAPKTSFERLKLVRVGTSENAAAYDRAAAGLTKAISGYRAVKPNGLAGGGGASTTAELPIVNGGNIAVSYSYGDVETASVGTVTAVCGDTVWAYGHMNEGNSKFAASIHGASAADITRSAGGSFKLMSKVGAPVGKLTDDRIAGVRGTLYSGGAKPLTTVPVKITSKVGSHSSTSTSYVTEKAAIAQVASAQITNDAMRMNDNIYSGSATVKWTIDYKLKNGKTGKLTRSDKIADPSWLPELIGEGVAGNIAELQANGIETVTITGVKIAATFTDDYLASKLKGVQMRKSGKWVNLKASGVTKVKRGKTYSFRAVMSPAPNSDGKTEYVPFKIAVAKNTKKKVTVNLDASGMSDMLFEDDFEYLAFEEGAFTSVAQLVEALEKAPRADQMTRTVTYTKTSKKVSTKVVREKKLTSPQVITEGSFKFTLEAPKLKKKMTKKKTKK